MSRGFKQLYKSLQCRVHITVLLGVLLSAFGLFYLETTISERKIREDIDRSLRHISSVIYIILEETMAKGRTEDVPARLKSLMAVPDIAYIRLVDQRLVPKFSVIDKAPRTGVIKNIRYPIKPKKVCIKCHGRTPLIGYLEIGFDISTGQKRLRSELTRHLGLYTLMFLAVFSYLVIILRKDIFQRLDRLKNTIEFFGRGDFNTKADDRGDDELSHISRVFNKMAENIHLFNQRLYRISEFSIYLSKKETLKEVADSTKDFIKDIFHPNSVEVTINEKIQSEWKDSKQKSEIKEIMGIPLMVNKKERGWIRISDFKRFTEIDRRILQLISLVTSAAIERINHQQQIDRLKEELMHLDRLSTVGTMVGAMVHEINNPLCVISSNAEEIEDLLDTKSIKEEEITEIKEYVEIINEAVKRIANYVDDMLRLVGKRRQAQKETIELNSIVKTILNLKKVDLKTNSIMVNTELTEQKLLIKGVKHQIEQVLLNLINNAEYAMSKYKGKGTLTVVTKKKDDQGIIEIHDTGPGIPEDVLPSIFDSFFTTKPPGEGTGLGLAIVKNIVKEHNGTIQAMNRIDGGATFIVSFPLLDN